MSKGKCPIPGNSRNTWQKMFLEMLVKALFLGVCVDWMAHHKARI